jgi:hypothetical protein
MAATSHITSLIFSDFVDTTARLHATGDSLVNDLAAVKSLYKVNTIPKGTGSQRIHDEYDTETYARLKIESGDIAKVQAIKGWSKTATMRRFGAEISISWEMRNVGKDQEVISRLKSLAQYCPQRMALDLTHRFTFATSTSYTDMDGETVDVSMGSTTSTALIDSTQDLTGSTSTYSTVITGTPAFSKGAFQIARERANTQVVDNFNNRRILNFNTIVTSDDPDTVDEVLTLKKSTSDPTQNNPGVVNNYANSFNHVVLPRLATDANGAYDSTKAKWWFYLASNDVQAYLDIYETPSMSSPSSGNNGEDIHNQDWTFTTTAAYAICIVVARGFLGSCP